MKMIMSISSMISDRQRSVESKQKVAFNNVPGSLALICETFGLTPNVIPPDDLLEEMVATVHRVVATLPKGAQTVVSEFYGVKADSGKEPARSDEQEMHIEKVRRLLRHPSRARVLRRFEEEITRRP